MKSKTESTPTWPSGKELEVLRILHSKGTGMYGLELVEKSDGAITRASVYIYLARLEEKGFVQRTKKAGPHPGLPRPIYTINAAGQRVLAAADMALGYAGARA